MKYTPLPAGCQYELKGVSQEVRGFMSSRDRSSTGAGDPNVVLGERMRKEAGQSNLMRGWMGGGKIERNGRRVEKRLISGVSRLGP